MTNEELIQLITSVWTANAHTSAQLAEAVFTTHHLPPAAPILIENLSALLTDLQKRAFFHGAVAIIHALKVGYNPETSTPPVVQ